MTTLTTEPTGGAGGAGVADRLDLLTRQVAELATQLREEREQREQWVELVHELTPVSSEAMATATQLLSDAEAKGYFGFIRGGAGVVDKVVTSFSEDDVDALGDNIVLILNTVKEMTQPEVMALLQRTAVTAQEVEEAHGEPPSLLGLLKQMRDPATRRGLGRAMTLLRSIGEESPATGPTPHTGR